MATFTFKPVETSCHRDYLYVGGTYVDCGSGNGEEALRGQMYVERLSPVHGQKHEYPLVFIHGGGQSGTNWLNAPDGRKGWASYFLDQGYVVYIVDQTAFGRSGSSPADSRMSISAEFVERRFTATESFKLWPQSHLHAQWPGSGRKGDPIFDAYYASNVPFPKDFGQLRASMRDAGATLLERIGPSVLISHSLGGPSSWTWADARPELVKAVIAIEPTGPPFRKSSKFDVVASAFATDATSTLAEEKETGIEYQSWTGFDDLEYEPPVTNLKSDLSLYAIPSESLDLEDVILQREPVRKLKNLQKVPVLLVTGEASYHAPYDHCTVAFLQQAGVKVDHFELRNMGIRGNGHMLFMELNNLDSAKVIAEWMREKFKIH